MLAVARCAKGLWPCQNPLKSVEVVEVSGKRHWSACSHERGVFARTMARLAAVAAVPKTAMIDATSLKAHRTATRLRSKRGGQATGGAV